MHLSLAGAVFYSAPRYMFPHRGLQLQNSCDYGMSPLYEACGRWRVTTGSYDRYQSPGGCQHTVSYYWDPELTVAVQTVVVVIKGIGEGGGERE